MVNKSLAIRNELRPKNAEVFSKCIKVFAPTGKGGNSVLIPSIVKLGKTVKNK